MKKVIILVMSLFSVLSIMLYLSGTFSYLFGVHYHHYSEDCASGSRKGVITEGKIHDIRGLKKMGYDLPDFSRSTDYGWIYVCVDNESNETWYFGTKSSKEDNGTIVELTNFMIDIDDIYNFIEEYDWAEYGELTLYDEVQVGKAPYDLTKSLGYPIPTYSIELGNIIDMENETFSGNISIIVFPDLSYHLYIHDGTFGTKELKDFT